MIQIHAIEKQQHALLVAMQSFLIRGRGEPTRPLPWIRNWFD